MSISVANGKVSEVLIEGESAGEVQSELNSLTVTDGGLKVLELSYDNLEALEMSGELLVGEELNENDEPSGNLLYVDVDVECSKK